jgi:5'-deoxynucleotidase YfbR-like HD superfamily hydrolase
MTTSSELSWLLDWRYAGGFAPGDELLQQLAPSKPANVTRYEECRKILVQMDPELGTEKAFNGRAQEAFEHHIRWPSGKKQIQLHKAKDALLVAHALVMRYAEFGQSIKNAKGTRRRPIPKHFERVYPNTVNTFVKDILNISQDQDTAARLQVQFRQADVARACIRIIQSAPFSATRARESAGPEVHAAYTLGRITNHAALMNASETLQGFEDKISRLLAQFPPHREDRSRQLRLMRRTAMLSLAMLGDTAASKRYLDLLLSDRLESDVNAGFHLEYYADQVLDESIPLCSHDLGAACENTLNYLRASLEHAIDIRGREAHPLFHINLYTFTSIVARRLHAARDDMGVMVALLQRSLGILEDDDLKLYVNLCVELYGAPRGAAEQRVGNYLATKNVPRSGWVARLVQFPESVGAHTASAIWLANLITESDAMHLDVPRVKRMLEVHDLAEGIVGDIVSTRKDEGHEERERRLIRELSWLGTYMEPPINFYPLYAAYLEFHEHQTAEAKLAHEIDSIDIVLQGQSLLKSNAKFQENAVQELITRMKKKIQTSAGKRIMALVQQMDVFTASSFAQTPDSAIKNYYFPAASRSRDPIKPRSER